MNATRRQVLAFRVHAQQLDRTSGSLDDTAVLDLGVQDTGPDGARWALALRGVDVGAVDDRNSAMAWTIRGAPHLYRRGDLPGVLAATAPFSDADAGKRIYDAAKPLKAAGIGQRGGTRRHRRARCARSSPRPWSRARSRRRSRP